MCEHHFFSTVEPSLCFAGGISYASCTYRLFKLPKRPFVSEATVSYKGTLADFPCQLDFDSSHSFKVVRAYNKSLSQYAQCFNNVLLFPLKKKLNHTDKNLVYSHLKEKHVQKTRSPFRFVLLQKDVAVKVSGEMAAILQSSRLCPDFEIQMSDKPEPGSESQPQVSAPHCGNNGVI